MGSHSSMGRGMDAALVLGQATAGSSVGSSVTDLAAGTDLSRSQVSRTLAALSGYELVERRGSGYLISSHVYAAAQALTERRLRTDGLTILETLSAKVGLPCFLGELYGRSTVTIAECIPARSDLIGSWVGRAYPVFCSDAGQATLWDASDAEIRGVLYGTDFESGGPSSVRSADEFIAHLEASRVRGYSVVDQEAEAGLTSVAAPVFDFRGEAVAGLQVVGERDDVLPRIGDLGKDCRAAAANLSRLLSGDVFEE